MTILNSPDIITQLKKDYPVDNYFTDGICPYQYRTYARGEFMQTPVQNDHCVRIILKGTILLYTLSQNGSKSPIATIRDGRTCGDVELCGYNTPCYAEILEPTTCIVLKIADCRKYLMNDPVFLYYLLQSVSEKLAAATVVDYGPEDMEERILNYFRTITNSRIDYVEQVTYDLRCSRSSLQRGLSSLCRQGKLRRIGKGTYELADGLSEAD